jgi:hypothetical protein
MSEWPWFHITLFCLVSALSIQTWTAFLALHILFVPGSRRLPWAAFCLGQILLILQCYRPLELAWHTGLYDFSQALLALLISILMLLAVLGLTSPTVGTKKNRER